MTLFPLFLIFTVMSLPKSSLVFSSESHLITTLDDVYMIQELLNKVFFIDHQVVLKIDLDELALVVEHINGYKNSFASYKSLIIDKLDKQTSQIKNVHHKILLIENLLASLDFEGLPVGLDKHRSKRDSYSIAPGVGFMLKTLFGTATSGDVDKVVAQQTRLKNAIGTYGKVIRKELKFINKNIHDIHVLKNKLDQLQKFLVNMGDQIQVLTILETLDTYFQIFTQIREELFSISEAILLARLGVVSPSLITPKFLYSFIRNATNNEKIFFPYDLSQFLVTFSYLDAVVLNNYIYINVPFSSKLPFNQTKYHALPFNKNNVSYVVDVYPHPIALSQDFSVIVPMPPMLTNKCYSPVLGVILCDSLGVKFYSISSLRKKSKLGCICSTNQKVNILDYCELHRMVIKDIHFIHVDHYYYITVPPLLQSKEIITSCPARRTFLVNSSIAILDACSISTSEFTISSTVLYRREIELPVTRAHVIKFEQNLQEFSNPLGNFSLYLNQEESSLSIDVLELQEILDSVQLDNSANIFEDYVHPATTFSTVLVIIIIIAIIVYKIRQVRNKIEIVPKNTGTQ